MNDSWQTRNIFVDECATFVDRKEQMFNGNYALFFGTME